MKNYFFLLALCVISFLVSFIHSCKKDDSGVTIPTNTPSDSIITTSFMEEFQDVYTLTTSTGWVTKDNSPGSMYIGYALWGQGVAGTDKSGQAYGFPAYSYSSSENEYAFSAGDNSSSISSWLITPILSVKNGDKISFYTRSDVANHTDRMQVLMDKSGSADVGSTLNSVGGFTTTLFDINPAEASNGYPATWTKYEYTFSGISAKMDIRIAFRHYSVDPVDATGVAIDLFEFQVN